MTFNTATNTWGTPETVTANIDSTDIGQGDEMVAMHLDANGVPHVVYLDHDGTRRNAYYKNRIGGTWGSLLQVDSDITYGNNFKAWHPSIAFFPNGSLLAAWMSNDFNEGNAGIIYTRFRSTEGVWLSSVQVGNADHHGGIDSGVSLVITSDSVVHLSSTGAKNAQGEGQVRYYYSSNNGATWSANHWSGHGTHNVGVGPVGNSNRIRLFFHGPEDPNNDSIYVLTGGGATAWAGTATLYTSGGFDSSVSTRWAQFHHAYPSTTDVVYWDHIYPNIAYAGTDVAKERSVPSSVLTTSQDISIIVPAEVAALKENERNVTTAVKTAQFIERTVPSSVATLSGDLERNVTASIDVLAEEERTVPSVVRIQQTDIERSVASAIDTQQTLERTVGASIATLEERERSLGASIVTISDSLDRTVPASIAVIDTQERTVSSTIEVVEENIERSVGASVATLEERERAVSASVVSNLESGREVPASIVVIAIDVERTVPAQVRGSTTEERTVPAGVFAGVENERYIPSTVITSFANIPIVIRLEEAELVVRFEIEEFSGA